MDERWGNDIREDISFLQCFGQNFAIAADSLQMISCGLVAVFGQAGQPKDNGFLSLIHLFQAVDERLFHFPLGGHILKQTGEGKHPIVFVPNGGKGNAGVPDFSILASAYQVARPVLIFLQGM